jgi:hypothetical protein
VRKLGAGDHFIPKGLATAFTGWAPWRVGGLGGAADRGFRPGNLRAGVGIPAAVPAVVAFGPW